ncbi:hypothetical protein [Planomonospora sp. ID82291]|uniref:hypothetical protein n=1 Tax=Planomonospora sp. ID82291 TaxID=2738136 RepID=UPI0018C423E9|nr:hypothetical protein [Planomonospora sp. ID82291]MBG0818394.1 hypothetical protein [Planomonospora sp. ID82291]
MAFDDLLGMLRTLMWVEYSSGMHLSQSSTPGRFSALVRDDDNTLVEHAKLLPAEAAIKVGAAVCVSAGVVVGVVASKAAPHVKSRFNDLKSRVNRKSEDTVEAAARETIPEQSDMGIEEPRGESQRLYGA